MRALLPITLLAVASPTLADTLVAARTLRGQTVISEMDLMYGPDQPGALREASQAIGMETRVNIYEGRPIRASDLQPAAVVARNQIVPLNYIYSGLVIATEARALERGGIGARIRVMNLESRNTVTGTVMPDGSVTVAPRGN
ncbi:flagellar basal body P-ring formation chaperone FlgA [Fluviibacterium sp. DFM31]|uniref:Flagella basal body P-ring formation protein FlgA n=1 Tax=Meridianimarinicoccus marinus TaxID=3231483 RepID=A0ABV3L339_9RHOB